MSFLLEIKQHILPNRSKLLWIPQSMESLVLGGIRYIQPENEKDIAASLLLHSLTEGANTDYLKEIARKVRMQQGTLRLSSSPQALGAMIKTNPAYAQEQFQMLLQIFMEPECTSEEFVSHQSQFTNTLSQSSHNAQAKLRLSESFSDFQAYEPYLSNQKKLVLDMGMLSHEDFETSAQQMTSWHMVYFMVGGEMRIFEQLKNTLEQVSSLNTPAVPIFAQDHATIDRHLCEDPEAVQMISFSKKIMQPEDQWQALLLTSFLENRFSQTDTQVRVRFSEEFAHIGFEKNLPITEIPGQMEFVWKEVLALKSSPPTKQELELALYQAKTKLAQVFYNPDLLFQTLVSQSACIYSPELLSSAQAYDQLDISDWMLDLKNIFDFEKQHVFEVVPQMYGHGASTQLRMDSLKKRLGIKKEEPQSFLADQYQFASIPVITKSNEKGQYAHAIDLNLDHTLMVNVCPMDPLAHLTVYFEGGRRFEHEKNAGITQLLLMSILNGSQEKRSIKKELEDLGVQVELENTADFFGFHFTMHPSLVSKLVSKISDLIYNTSFSDVFINEIKLQLLKEQTIKAREPFFRSVELFYQSMFGVHGYGQPRLGSQYSILNITASQLDQMFGQDVRDSSSTLWIMTSPEKHEDIPLELSKKIPSRIQSVDEKAQVLSMFPKKQFKVMKDTRSSNLHSVCMGLKTVNVKDQRQYYLDIMQIYLSGMGGKLSDALIEKLNIVDTVKAYHVHLLQAGVFFIQLHSKQVEDTSLFEYLQTIFTSLTTVSPSMEALESARELAVLRKKHRLQQPRELSYDIGSRHFAGMGWEDPRLVEDAIRSTKPSELTQAMSELMDYNSFAMGIC